MELESEVKYMSDILISAMVDKETYDEVKDCCFTTGTKVKKFINEALKNELWRRDWKNLRGGKNAKKSVKRG